MHRVVGILSVLPILISAQPRAGQVFDAASVKPAKDLQVFKCGFGPGGRFRAFGPAQWLIACAYGILQSRAHLEILGGPTWLNEELFDIVATTAPENVPDSESAQLAMIRALLADRFKLVVHRDTKELPIYALVMARKDGRLGPQLRRTETSCAAWIAGGRQGPPPSVADLPCGRQVLRATLIQGSAVRLAQLGNLLSSRVGRPIEDHTGLSGTFYVNLQWAPEVNPQPTSSPDVPAVPTELPTSIFTAVQEQLGLKLESSKGFLGVLIIDHIERPAPN